jgi:signal transduction histidine kinase
MLHIIKEDGEKPETKEDWDVVMRNIDYIENIVSETLKIAELSSTKVTFEMNDTNLLDLVNNTIKDNKIVFDKNNIKIENMINEKITVNGDELRIKEVFCNLIINAVKFTPENGSILVDAKKDNDYVIISIKDTGMGLTQGEIEHIFDEFYKADAARHDMESSGLGLSICKRIVEKHGGRIWAESPGPGKGTTVYFTLKLGNKEVR